MLSALESRTYVIAKGSELTKMSHVNNPSPTISIEEVESVVDEALEDYEPEEVNYPEVVTHADLPDTVEFTNETFIVLVGTGIFGINKKRAGLWRSNGVAWYRLGALEGSGGVLYSSPPSGKKRVNNVYFDPEVGVNGKYVMEREE